MDKKIVRVFDRVLDNEQRTKELAGKLLTEIESLKRKILARGKKNAKCKT